MSRYADRRNLQTPSSQYGQQGRGGTPQYHQQFSRQGEARRSGLSKELSRYEDYGVDDEDDGSTIVDGDTQVSTQVSTVASTAVGTDLSDYRPPMRRRSVSFGANEVEEFNGSEAPDAIEPAPSRQGNRTPVPPSNGTLLRAVPIGRPPSRSNMDFDQTGRRSPASQARPPPSTSRLSTQRIPSRSSLREVIYPEPDRFSSTPTRGGYSDSVYFQPQGENFVDDGGYLDDDDAFTAVADSVVGESTAGTGVASDLSFDYEPNPRRSSAGDNLRPSFPSVRASPAPFVQRSGYSSQPSSITSASGFDSSYFSAPDVRGVPSFSAANGGGLVPPASMQRPRSTGSLREQMQVDEGTYSGDGIRRNRTPSGTLPSNPPPALEDSPVERELINLLKELQFSLALKDFHDETQIGVTRTLVAEDGLGHAYCKIHCKKLPRPEEVAKHPHMRKHWVPIAGSRWEFRTASHSVTVVFKTAALAAHEAQYTTGRR